MANYVLVQGGNMSTDTWNRLSGQQIVTETGYMGAKYWDGTIKALISAGNHAYAPELLEESISNLSDHIEQVCTLISEKNLQKVILVGHSYGGLVITGVAHQMPHRIQHLVYLDSAIPEPGQSLIEILNMVYCSEDYEAALPEPNPPYVEKLQYDPRRIEKINKIYIRCTNSEFIDVTRLSKEKVEDEKGEWTYFELPSSHIPMADLPEPFYKLLSDIMEL